jgi:hypothetical protein
MHFHGSSQSHNGYSISTSKILGAPSPLETKIAQSWVFIGATSERPMVFPL